MILAYKGKQGKSVQKILYIRLKPHEKIKEIQLTRQNFNSFMTISSSANQSLQLWVKNIQTSYKNGTPEMILFTDASKSGWGGYDKTNYRKTGGVWSTEKQY